MKTEKTDNELIAEFRGAVESQNSGVCGIRTYWINNNDPTPSSTKEMHYNTSWDWLMPACQKFSSLEFDIVQADIEHGDHVARVAEKILEYDITGTCERLVEGIKWYNQQKST